MKYLNLGCGTRFHHSWINLDYVAAHPSVLSQDIRSGIPFPDEEFDAVYHSHLLEHLPKQFATVFLKECFRVLKVGGTIRVVVPDLEGIAKTYLHALNMAMTGDREWRDNYQWIMLELFDQTVRERSRGEMGNYLSREDVPNKDFVASRIGAESMMAPSENTENESQSQTKDDRTTLLRRLVNAVRHPETLKEAIVRRLLYKDYELLQLGRFRNSGEIHHWMYDRYSLAQALLEAGFQSPQVVGPSESRIPEFANYQLDTGPDGEVHKPDSIFMEAVK